MLAALEEVGCQRYYPQLLLGNLEDFDLVLDSYQP
jgi:hypothetical protein